MSRQRITGVKLRPWGAMLSDGRLPQVCLLSVEPRWNQFGLRVRFKERGHMHYSSVVAPFPAYCFARRCHFENEVIRAYFEIRRRWRGPFYCKVNSCVYNEAKDGEEIIATIEMIPVALSAAKAEAWANT